MLYCTLVSEVALESHTG